MKTLFIIGYVIFLVGYGLFVVALAYHERKFTFENDPIRFWSKIIQLTMAFLFITSFVFLASLAYDSP